MLLKGLSGLRITKILGQGYPAIQVYSLLYGVEK